MAKPMRAADKKDSLLCPPPHQGACCGPVVDQSNPSIPYLDCREAGRTQDGVSAPLG